MPLFTTDFQPPDPITGMDIEALLDESVVRITWDPTVLPDVDFGGYRVYRSVGGGEFELMAFYSEVNEATFEDYTTPLNVAVTYRVTQANLDDLESDPVGATVSLESHAWWAVSPDDPTLTFPVTRMTGAVLRSEKVEDAFTAVGREGKIRVGDVVLDEAGTLSFRVMPDEPGKIALIRRLQDHTEGSLMLKATDGTVHYVAYGNMSRSFEKGGMQNINISFDGVS